MGAPASFMKAIAVLEALSSQPWAEGSLVSGVKTAYDIVSADPSGSVSVLAGRVATAAASQGFIVQPPAPGYPQAGGYVMQQLPALPPGGQHAQQHAPPKLCWRCGAVGHLAPQCKYPVNPANRYPYKPRS